MLKDIVEKYTTVSLEDADADEPLDEVVTEETETETEEEETSDTTEETPAEEEENEAEDAAVETEETESDTNVLENPVDEQGEISTSDSEEVVAEVEPSEDVQEAGDNIGQETPVDAFDGTTDTADITEGSDSGALGEPDIAATDAQAVETVVTEGTEVAEGQAEIIQQAEQAASELEGGATDENGNAITEEEAEVNEEEAAVDAEIDAQAEEQAETTDVVGEETPEELAEDAAEEEAVNDEETALDGVDELGNDSTEATAADMAEGGDDVFDTNSDTDSDTSGSTDGIDTAGDSETGDDSTEETFEDDDVPLEGAEDTSEGDTVDTDVTEEVSEESTEGTDTEVTEGDTTDVQESVDDQNEASAVTAEAASSDVNQTDAIDGNNEVTSDDAVDGLDVEVDDSFKQTEVDGNPSTDNNAQDDTAATVEETIDNPDGTEENLANGIAEGVADDAEEMEEAVAETEAEETTDEETVVDEDVVEDDSEPDFEEGEVDIPDVDTAVTDDDVAEAEVAADDVEVLADTDEDLAIDASKTIEELQEEAKGLESFIKELEEAISTEKYDAGRMVTIYAKLDQHQQLWDEVKVPSLEDYGRNDMDLLYKASLESARGFVSKITQTSTRMRDKLTTWWARPMVTKVITRVEAVNKAADKALVDLKASGFTGGEVTGVAGYLSTDKAGLVSAVSSDLKITTAIITKGLNGNEKLISAVVGAIDDVVRARKPEDIKPVLGQIKNFKPAKASYPTEAFTKGNLMGNWKLEMKEGSIGQSGIPVAVKETSGDRKTSFKVTKADLSNLLLMAKTYTALARKSAETTGEKALKEIPAQFHQRARILPVMDGGRVLGDKDDEKAIDSLATDVQQVAKAHNDVYKFIVKHALDMAEAIIAVVNKAQ